MRPLMSALGTDGVPSSNRRPSRYAAIRCGKGPLITAVSDGSLRVVGVAVDLATPGTRVSLWDQVCGTWSAATTMSRLPVAPVAPGHGCRLRVVLAQEPCQDWSQRDQRATRALAMRPARPAEDPPGHPGAFSRR